MSNSGKILRIDARIRVESTPPLSAIHNFFGLNLSIVSCMFYEINSLTNSNFGGSSLDTKSFHDFLGRFGDILES